MQGARSIVNMAKFKIYVEAKVPKAKVESINV